MQIVAAVLSDPQLAELLLGADGRGASPREARAAVDDVLGGKSSVNKRELAEAMAQRASEQSSPMRGQYASSSPAERARAAAEAKDRAARAFERMDKRGPKGSHSSTIRPTLVIPVTGMFARMAGWGPRPVLPNR